MYEVLKFDDIKIGQKATFTKTITEEDVVKFSEVSGDVNPIHMDEEYAKNAMFGKRIAHGIISVGLISAVLGTKLPGVGCIYMSQEVKFMAPVFFNDELTAIAEVVEKVEDKKRLKIKTSVVNQDGKVVTEGFAVLLHKH